MPSYHEEELKALSYSLTKHSSVEDLSRLVHLRDVGHHMERNRQERGLSELQDWCMKRNVEVPDTLPFLSEELSSLLPLSKEIEYITKTMVKTDVTLLMARTGSGKSLLAPLIFKRYMEDIREYSQYSNDIFDYANKCLMFVPNGEHVGGCTRFCTKLYMRDSMKCQVAGYYSAYEKVTRDKRIGGFLEEGPLEFNIVSYEFGEKLLSDSFLNVLILDEAHESNPSIVMSIAAARRMLTGDGNKKRRRLDRLLLMTATMTDQDVADLRRSFVDKGLTFQSITLDEDAIPRDKILQMSCLATPGEKIPTGFTRSSLSHALDNCNQSYTGEVFKEAPNMRLIEDRLEVALDYAMMKSGEVVRSQTSQHVPSIVVILPGLEHVEKFFSKVRTMHHFKVTIKDGSKLIKDDAFVPIRITSTVKDDDKVTSPCVVMGAWGGRRGRIVFTTNMIASGLTVPGAAWIIDCGVVKIVSEYQRNGLFSLDMEFVDREMMIQRAGRTGRTHSGEYCIVLSSTRVNEIARASVRRKQLMRQFDENHFFRMKMHNLELAWKLDDEIVERFEKSFQTRGYMEGTNFTPSTLHLAELFPFLPPDYARIIVQGIRLGFAAHVVLYIADLLTSVKFIPPATKGREREGGPSDSCTATDRFANVMYDSRELGGDVGDSIVHTDYLTTFFHMFTSEEVGELSKAGDAHNINEEAMPEGSFWRGEWTLDMLGDKKHFKDIYSLFVRDEGREALLRYRRQIEGACRALGLLKGSLFDRRFNRYWIDNDNACLNEDGRALFMAVLTMHSSRVGVRVPDGSEARKRRLRDTEMYTVHDENSSHYKKNSIVLPERVQWQAHAGLPFGRYTEAFRRGNSANNYIACLDAISVPQLAYFMNINSKMVMEDGPPATFNVQKFILKLDLNGSPGKRGVQLSTYKQTAKHVIQFRDMLRSTSERLLVDKDKELSERMERAVIDMWKTCSSSALTGYRQCTYDSDDY